jgi:hypothetical protein
LDILGERGKRAEYDCDEQIAHKQVPFTGRTAFVQELAINF